jgi:hypothetical protein
LQKLPGAPDAWIFNFAVGNRHYSRDTMLNQVQKVFPSISKEICPTN